ncbi:MAG: TraB/GumN family protein [Planctomycetia bacterium]|nr:TraB/GumN family protein [Planctomycetia bacterium]
MNRFCMTLLWPLRTSCCFAPSKQVLVPQTEKKNQVRRLRNVLLLFMVCSGLFLFQLNAFGQKSKTHSETNAPSKSDTKSTKVIALGQQAQKLYMKLDTTPKGLPLSLQTSIVTLSSTRKNKPVQIHLVGAIHFADPEYYRELDRRLAEYEMVLFELVTEKNTDAQALLAKREKPSGETDKTTKTDKETKDSSAKRIKRSPFVVIGAVQKLMCDTLGLTSQLVAIDYSRKNMVHCDMDNETLLKEILKGDDINTLVDEFLTSFMQQEQGKEFGVLAAVLFSQNRQMTLRRMAARELAKQMSPDKVTIGQKSLIEARNSVVLDRIRRELDGGKTQIAVFYGAAHLPDFIVRLQTQYGFKVESCQWIQAWNMKP